ncbi:hypothetical protein FRC20_003343 [Serendipita sp. 405]|nr:hypothetical protein FRC20_003343 [Serendipita sp. 405]
MEGNQTSSGELAYSSLLDLHLWLEVWLVAWYVFEWFPVARELTACSFQSLLVLKYIVPNLEPRFQYYGYANVAQNIALMLSAVVLWLAQHASSEYEYNLQL